MTTTNHVFDLSHAKLVVPSDLSQREELAVRMFVEEVERRTLIRLEVNAPDSLNAQGSIVLSPRRLIGAFRASPSPAGGSTIPETVGVEGYVLQSDESSQSVLVIGDDERGFLFGIGRLLRALRMRTGRISIPAALSLATAPSYKLRGHQIGYRDKVNSYDGWDLPQWERYIRDLIVFGANAIEMIPPRSDDKPTSVHFPRPPLEIIAGVSQLADDYGLDVWMWYPALDEDYTDPATIEFALKEWKGVLEVMPRLNAMFIPGGDPGGTPPRPLFKMLTRQAEQLEGIHPGVTWWISPQGFSDEKMEAFIQILREDPPDWLTGIVHGPWIHSSISDFRKRIPDRFPIRNYPDITHTLSCQFPVPNWDVACAMTIGREPVNPRPTDEAAIFRFSQPGSIGFLAYCEGCHDDVNKAVWSALAWDPQTSLREILTDYARYFIDDAIADEFAQGLFALERNWKGPVATNTGIDQTLMQFRAMEERVSPWTLKNWRFLQALYRAYYDAYVRNRLLSERALEARAMEVLRRARTLGSFQAISEAERILDAAVTMPVAADLRTRVFQLAEALFQSDAHMQLSTHLYQGQEEVRGANLDGIDFPLNDRPWLLEQFRAIHLLDDESKRLEGIDAIVNWTNPGPGGYYDDLGASVDQPRVVQAVPYHEDPAFLKSPQHRYPYRKAAEPIRLSWRGYTGPINDAPFRMRYTDLDPDGRYRIRMVYSSMDMEVKVHLTANGEEVHPWMVKPSERGPIEYPVPVSPNEAGELEFTWERERGRGHSGIGCDLSEVWLIKDRA